MPDEVTVVRIYISEADHGRRRNLMREILALLRDQHKIHGVTVFRGVAGFGASGEVHAADLLRLTADLPLVVEFFDEPTLVDAAVTALNGLIPEGHMISWSAQRRRS
jgi:uncharacterized protein